MSVTARTGEVLALSFETKAVDGERREISGHAAAWCRDLVDDEIERGAFTKTIADRLGSIDAYVGHDMAALPVGTILEAHEDAVGLAVKVKVFQGGRGDELLSTTRELMSMGRSMSMSIGFRIPKGGSRYEQVGGRSIRKISQIDLVEISFTTMPANPAATVAGVKNADVPDMLSEDALRAFFEEESRRLDAELLAFFDPDGVMREIDNAIKLENLRQDADTEQTMEQIRLALLGPVGVDRELLREAEAGDSKSLQSPSYARMWKSAHPGGIDTCRCRGHQLARGEILPGDAA